ncbi:hypothetical protein L1049_016841 [Liquidambar formosana]|uniref:Uncharacterized protein n=1 Tax=Liquidambar formosana TaxID=63359 RepID=A0AAP0X7T1_LIQFO
MKDNGSEVILCEDICENEDPLTSPIQFTRLIPDSNLCILEADSLTSSKNTHGRIWLSKLHLKFPGACKAMQYNITPENTSKKTNKAIMFLLVKIYRD